MEIDWTTILSLLAPAIPSYFAGFLSKSGRVKTQADAYKAQAEAYEFRITSMNAQLKVYDEMERKHAQRISELNIALDDKERYHSEREDKLEADIHDKTDYIRNIHSEFEKERRESEEEQARLNSQLIQCKDKQVELTKEKGELEVELARKRCDDIYCPFRRPPTADTPSLPEISKEQWHLNKNINIQTK